MSMQEALYEAIMNKEFDKMEDLISQGADVNGPDSQGRFPMDACLYHVSPSVLSFLIERGLDPNTCSDNPFDYLRDNGHAPFRDLLLEHGVPPYVDEDYYIHRFYRFSKQGLAECKRWYKTAQKKYLALHSAMKKSVKVAQGLLDEGYPLDRLGPRDPNGFSFQEPYGGLQYSPLAIAVAEGTNKMVKFMIEKVKESKHPNALAKAFAMAISRENHDRLTWLLQAGFEPLAADFEGITNPTTFTTLLTAIRDEEDRNNILSNGLKALLESYHALPDMMKFFLSSPAKADDAKLLKKICSKQEYGHLLPMLVERGIDVCQGEYQDSPLIAAAELEDETALSTLIDLGVLEKQPKAGPLALEKAVSRGLRNAVALLLESGVELVQNILCKLRCGAEVVVARLLIQAGAEVDEKALSFAADSKNEELYALYQKHAKTATLEALCVACEQGSEAMVQSILNVGGFDLHGKHNEKTCLEYALKPYHPNVNVVQALINAGVEIVSLSPSKLVSLPLDIIKLVHEAAQEKDKDGNTPTHYAATSYKDEKLSFFLSRDPLDVHVCNKKGLTPYKMAFFEDRRSAMKLLFEAGSDPNVGPIPDAEVESEEVPYFTEFGEALDDDEIAEEEEEIYEDWKCRQMCREEAYALYAAHKTLFDKSATKGAARATKKRKTATRKRRRAR